MNTEYLIAILGDVDTIEGFEIAGLVNINNNLVKLSHHDNTDLMASKFLELVTRKDIAILLVCDKIALRIEHLIRSYKNSLPSILIIPSKIKEN